MIKPILSLLAAAGLLTGCDSLKKPETKDQLQEATANPTVVYRNGKTSAGVAANAASAVDATWDLAKAKRATVNFKEISLSGITVRGDSTYNVYSVEESVLFDTDKADLKPAATELLKQIAGSISQRHGSSQVRVMGFADSHGDKGYKS